MQRQSCGAESVHGLKTGGKNGKTLSNQDSPRAGPICTNSGCGSGGVVGIGFSVCGARQLSSIPTCCTQETVHFGAQNFEV